MILFRYAQDVNQNIGALGSKVEEQLKEINQKCSDLQKQENRVRKCLKKLSGGIGSKKESDNESNRTTSSNGKERHEKKGLNGNYLSSSENDYLQSIDYNRIIKNAMKHSDSNPNDKKSSKSKTSTGKYDGDIIDVDAICRTDDGMNITLEI